MHKIDFTIPLTLSQYTQLSLIHVVPAMSLLIFYSLINLISLCSLPIPLCQPIIFPVPLNCHYPREGGSVKLSDGTELEVASRIKDLFLYKMKQFYKY